MNAAVSLFAAVAVHTTPIAGNTQISSRFLCLRRAFACSLGSTVGSVLVDVWWFPFYNLLDSV